jgi:hypothetical protein
MIAFFVIVTFMFVIYMAIDYVIIKKFMKDSLDRVNAIFDGIKTFFLVTLVERISSAFTSDDSDDSDDSELHCS